MTSALADLTKKEKDDECVKFAIQLRDAWSLKNYLRFFRLYRSSPKMTGYLVDWFINRERKAALRTIIKAYVVFLGCLFQIQGSMGDDLKGSNGSTEAGVCGG